tara:strand:- start:1513 stop:2763 length:1251 start_codon:yes stop_codon:yes gene_type:complete
MKKLLLLLIIPLLSFGQDDDVKKVYINYKNSINGYKINVIWTPKKEYYGYVGVASIELESIHNKEHRVVINYNHKLEEELVKKITFSEDEENNTLKIDKNYYLNIDYVEPENRWENQKYTSPFFFLDINYDDEKEFFFYSHCTGQRFYDDILVWDYYNGSLPRLDNYGTSFNYSQKKIQIMGSCGAFSTTLDVYNFINGQWKKNEDESWDLAEIDGENMEEIPINHSKDICDDIDTDIYSPDIKAYSYVRFGIDHICPNGAGVEWSCFCEGKSSSKIELSRRIDKNKNGSIVMDHIKIKPRLYAPNTKNLNFKRATYELHFDNGETLTFFDRTVKSVDYESYETFLWITIQAWNSDYLDELDTKGLNLLTTTPISKIVMTGYRNTSLEDSIMEISIEVLPENAEKIMSQIKCLLEK